jgi:hypothetical protein
MSKLAQAVTATDTKNRIVIDPLFDSMVSITHQVSGVPVFDPSVAYVYRIEAKFGTQCMVEYQHDGKANYVDEALRNTRKAIIEAVFGEFRQDFYLIHQALWKHELHKAHELLHAFEDKMFQVP